MSHKKILLVEDEALIAVAQKKVLEKYGYAVVTAHSGKKAIETVRSTPGIDLILMDINLGKGKMDGTEAAEVILRDHDIPVLFLSSYTQPEIVEKTERITSYGYVVKDSGETVLNASIKMAFKLYEAHQKVTQNAEQFRAVTNTSIDGFWLIDTEGRILDVNEAYCQMTGYGRDELLAMYIPDLDAVEDADMAREHMAKVIEKGSDRFESRHRCKDGRTIDVEVSTILTGEQKLLVFIQNITDRKKAQKALELQSAITETVGEGIFLIGVEDNIIKWANSKFEKMFGYGPGEMTGMHVDRVNAPTDRTPTETRISIVDVLLEKGEWHGEIKNVKKDGTHFWCYIRVSLFDHPEFGRVMVSAHTDTTGLKQGEQELRESKETFRAIADYTYDWENWVGPDGRLIWINPAVERLTGYSVKECLAMKDFPLPIIEDTDRERVAVDFSEAVKGASGDGVDFRVRCKDGTVKWFSASYQQIYDSAGKHLGHRSSIRDINDRKHAEETVQRDLEAMMVLHKLSLSSALPGTLSELLTGIVDAAIAITSADFGNIQLLDPETGRLRVVAHRNLPDWWLAFWETVSEGEGVCGTALQDEERVIVPDVEQSPIFVGTPALEIQLRAGIRAVQSTPLRSRDGRIIGMFSTHFKKPLRPDDRQIRLLDLLARQAADLVEQGRYEADLKQSEERYRTLFEAAADGIVIHDTRGRNIAANPRACEMLGYSRNELLAMSLSDLIPPEELQQNPPRLSDALAGRPVCYERKLRRKDGTLIDIEIRAGRVMEDKIQAFWRDITERKRAEKALRLEQERLAGILRGTNTGTWEWNLQTGEVVFNERWAEIIGYTLEEISPVSIETWEKFCHPEDLKVSGDLLERHFRGDLDYYECEARMRHKSGEWAWVLDRGQVITWASNGRPLMMMGTHQEITARKQAEDDIKSSLHEKEVLLKEIHHRVKNNLLVVSSILNLQSDTIMDRKAKDLIEDCRQRIHAMSIIHNRLYSSESLSRVSFKGYTEELLADIARSYGTRPGDVALVTDVGDITFDIETAIPLGLIMNELVSNAMKHAFSGERKGTIRVNIHEHEGRFLLTVRDNGVGFPEGIDFTATESLGMQLVVTLVEQLDGSIDLIRGNGTEFRVTFGAGHEAQYNAKHNGGNPVKML